MAVRYLFFNSTPTDRRKYHSQDFADNLNAIHESGLLHPYGQGQDNLRVEVTGGMETIVNTGNATILGHYFEVYGEPYELTHQYPDTTYNRIDRVVLRMDRTHNERWILPVVLTGTPALTPQPPALTRNKDIYDLSLMQIMVRANTVQLNSADMIDERFDDILCGPAYLKLPIKPEQIQDVMDAWFADGKREDYLKRSEKGIPNGLATLNAQGKITPSQAIDYVLKAEKGVANGFSPLDANNLVPRKHLNLYSPNNTVIKDLVQYIGVGGKSEAGNNPNGSPAPVGIESSYTFRLPGNGKFRITGEVLQGWGRQYVEVQIKVGNVLVAPVFTAGSRGTNASFTLDFNKDARELDEITISIGGGSSPGYSGYDMWHVAQNLKLRGGIV